MKENDTTISLSTQTSSNSLNSNKYQPVETNSSKSPEKLGFFDTVINGMNNFELNMTANRYVDAVRHSIDATRLYLQKDTTGGEGKQFAAFKNSNQEQNLTNKDLQDKFETYKASNPIKRTFLGSIGSGISRFGKSTLGFGITVGVQLGNSLIKTGALVFNTTKLGIMSAGALAGSKLCRENLGAEASNLKKDFKSTAIAYINTFAAATGIGAIVGAKAGLAYSVSQSMTSLANTVGNAMGITVTQVADAALTKKGLATVAELNKSEFYKQTASTMQQRDPEMYKKVVALRAEYIDNEKVSIETRRAAAVVEKEMLETFRNNQNTMVGMPVRVAKSTAARVSNLVTKGTASLTQQEVEQIKTQQSSLGKAMGFKDLQQRQDEGHKDIDTHSNQLKEYLKMRDDVKENGHSSLSAENKQKYVNLHRQFGKGSFSREM